MSSRSVPWKSDRLLAERQERLLDLLVGGGRTREGDLDPRLRSPSRSSSTLISAVMSWLRELGRSPCRAGRCPAFPRPDQPSPAIESSCHALRRRVGDLVGDSLEGDSGGPVSFGRLDLGRAVTARNDREPLASSGPRQSSRRGGPCGSPRRRRLHTGLRGLPDRRRPPCAVCPPSAARARSSVTWPFRGSRFVVSSRACRRSAPPREERVDSAANHVVDARIAAGDPSRFGRLGRVKRSARCEISIGGGGSLRGVGAPGLRVIEHPLAVLHPVADRIPEEGWIEQDRRRVVAPEPVPTVLGGDRVVPARPSLVRRKLVAIASRGPFRPPGAPRPPRASGGVADVALRGRRQLKVTEVAVRLVGLWVVEVLVAAGDRDPGLELGRVGEPLELLADGLGEAGHAGRVIDDLLDRDRTTHPLAHRLAVVGVRDQEAEARCDLSGCPRQRPPSPASRPGEWGVASSRPLSRSARRGA